MYLTYSNCLGKKIYIYIKFTTMYWEGDKERDRKGERKTERERHRDRGRK